MAQVNEDLDAIKMEMLGFIFVFWGCGLVAAVISFACEIMIVYKMRLAN